MVYIYNLLCFLWVFFLSTYNSNFLLLFKASSLVLAARVAFCLSRSIFYNFFFGYVLHIQRCERAAQWVALSEVDDFALYHRYLLFIFHSHMCICIAGCNLTHNQLRYAEVTGGEEVGAPGGGVTGCSRKAYCDSTTIATLLLLIYFREAAVKVPNCFQVLRLLVLLFV